MNPDVNKQNLSGNTPLHLALSALYKDDDNTHIEIAKKLVRHGADLNIKNEKAETPKMHYYCKGGNTEYLKEIIKESEGLQKHLEN